MSPQLIENPLDRKRMVRVNQKESQQRSLLRRAEVDSFAVTEHSEGAEGTKVHVSHTSTPQFQTC